MTKREFTKRIRKHFHSKNILENKISLGVCIYLRNYVSPEARNHFYEIFRPKMGDGNPVYFMRYGAVKGNECFFSLSPQKTLENRLNALLLFEQVCLEYKLYRDF